MAQNGGIIGPTNVTSFGKNKVTSKTSSGDITLQSGTRVIDYLVVAGGGGASSDFGGGGGAGGYRASGHGPAPLQGTSLCASGTIAATIGAGGSSNPNPGNAGTANTGGGGGGGGNNAAGSGGSGIVVIRGPSAVTFTGTPCCAFTASTHPGGDKIAKFTANGTLTIS